MRILAKLEVTTKDITCMRQTFKFFIVLLYIMWTESYEDYNNGIIT